MTFRWDILRVAQVTRADKMVRCLDQVVVAKMALSMVAVMVGQRAG